MMQIKFNFNNFIIYGVSATAWQRAKRHTPSSLAAVIGLSNNDVISLRHLRFLRRVRCVGWKPRFRHVQHVLQNRGPTKMSSHATERRTAARHFLAREGLLMACWDILPKSSLGAVQHPLSCTANLTFMSSPTFLPNMSWLGLTLNPALATPMIPYTTTTTIQLLHTTTLHHNN